MQTYFQKNEGLKKDLQKINAVSHKMENFSKMWKHFVTYGASPHEWACHKKCGFKYKMCVNLIKEKRKGLSGNKNKINSDHKTSCIYCQI